MSLLHNLRCSLNSLAHSEPGHHDGESASAEGGDGDVFFYFGELGCGGRGGEDADVVQLFEEEGFVFVSKGGVGGEGGETVG